MVAPAATPPGASVRVGVLAGPAVQLGGQAVMGLGMASMLLGMLVGGH